jgi:nitrogenase molybdenum-cofactor synthesis protein NifE
MSLERYESKEVKFSHWNLRELNQWNKLGLLPVHHSQDIEQLCAFYGAFDVLNWFDPQIKMLVHGSEGCALGAISSRAYPGASAMHKPKPLSTALTPHEIIHGGEKKLSECLEEIDKKYNAELIVVLTNCCSYLTGEDVPGIINKHRAKLKTDILNLEVSGCSGSGFRKGSDAAMNLIFEHIAGKYGVSKVNKKRPSINLFTKRVSGRPAEHADIAEIKRLLDRMGVDINVVVWLGTPYEDLMKIKDADANASLCLTFGKGPMESLKTIFGQKYAQTTFPMGLKATLDWLDQIAELVGVKNVWHDDPEVLLMKEKLDKVREKVAGREAYIWQPGEKGLATSVFSIELGMKPTLFGMSYYLEQMLRPTVELLLNRGYDIDLVMSGKYKLLTKAREIDLDSRPLIFMPKKFWLGRCPGVTFNFIADPILGLAGINTLIASVENALQKADHKDYNLFNRYIEILYRAVDWQIEGDVIKNADPNDIRWKRWNL